MRIAPAVQRILQHIFAAVVGQNLLHRRSHAAHHAARGAECAVRIEVIRTIIVVGCFLVTYGGQQRLHGFPTAALRRISRTACGSMSQHGFQRRRQGSAVCRRSVAQHLGFCFGGGYQHKTAALGKQKGTGCFVEQTQRPMGWRADRGRAMLHKPSLRLASCIGFAHRLCRNSGGHAAEYTYYI